MADNKNNKTPENNNEEVPKKKKKPKNYLNNKDMLAELRRCHEQDKMTEEFAKMMMLLADRYGSRYEYSDYSGHIEEMKAAAVLNATKIWRKFDIEKYDNPFAYFTQSVKHIFWQYVSQEKKHRLIRDSILIDHGELPSDTYLEDYEREREEAKKPKEENDDENVE